MAALNNTCSQRFWKRGEKSCLRVLTQQMLFELRDIKSLLLFFPSGVLLYEIQTFK